MSHVIYEPTSSNVLPLKHFCTRLRLPGRLWLFWLSSRQLQIDLVSIFYRSYAIIREISTYRFAMFQTFLLVRDTFDATNVPWNSMGTIVPSRDFCLFPKFWQPPLPSDWNIHEYLIQSIFFFFFFFKRNSSLGERWILLRLLYRSRSHEGKGIKGGIRVLWQRGNLKLRARPLNQPTENNRALWRSVSRTAGDYHDCPLSYPTSRFILVRSYSRPRSNLLTIPEGKIKRELERFDYDIAPLSGDFHRLVAFSFEIFFSLCIHALPIPRFRRKYIRETERSLNYFPSSSFAANL